MSNKERPWGVLWDVRETVSVWSIDGYVRQWFMPGVDVPPEVALAAIPVNEGDQHPFDPQYKATAKGVVSLPIDYASAGWLGCVSYKKTETVTPASPR